MKHACLAILALVNILGGCANAQADHATFTLEGRVLNEKTNEPIARAIVQLQCASSRVFNVFSTDQGLFKFDSLPSGTYVLTAIKPGFQPSHSAPSRESVGLILSASQSDLTISLEPLASVQGQTVSEDGKPIQDIQIELLSSTVSNGSKTISVVRSVSTDDIGHFRLWSLQPGEYYLRAVGRRANTSLFVGEQSGVGTSSSFECSYLGGGQALKAATPFQLSPGDSKDAGLTLSKGEAYRISGRISGLDPYRPLVFELIDEAGEIHQISAQVNVQTGEFNVPDVLSGSYTLRVTQGGSGTRVRAQTSVNLARKNSDGISLDLLGGALVRIAVHKGRPSTGLNRPAGADNSSSPSAELATCFLSLTPANPNDTDFYFTSPYDDITLQIENVFPGAYRVQTVCSGGYPSSLQNGDANILADKKLVIAERLRPVSLDLILDTNGAAIRGKVESPAVGAQVLLVPESTSGSEPMVLPLSDGGIFEAGSLAPGAYRAFLLANPDQLEYRSPEVVARLQGGERLELRAGETAQISLKGAAQ